MEALSEIPVTALLDAVHRLRRELKAAREEMYQLAPEDDQMRHLLTAYDKAFDGELLAIVRGIKAFGLLHGAEQLIDLIHDLKGALDTASLRVAQMTGDE